MERDFLLRRYAAWEERAPFYYDYADGWKQFFEYAATIIMLTMLTLSFTAAGIIPEEFSWKADAVFYASCHGRGKAAAAKLAAGVLFVTAAYFLVMAVYSAVVLGVLGGDGALYPVVSAGFYQRRKFRSDRKDYGNPAGQTAGHQQVAFDVLSL